MPVQNGNLFADKTMVNFERFRDSESVRFSEKKRFMVDNDFPTSLIRQIRATIDRLKSCVRIARYGS